MKTTVEIPDSSLETLLERTGAKTKKKAINIAVDDYLRRADVEELLSLQGTAEDFMTLEELDAMRNE